MSLSRGHLEARNATFPTDRIGKGFIMFVYGTSRCLVCNRLFTHKAAQVHTNIRCDPAVPDLRLLKESSVLILQPLHVTKIIYAELNSRLQEGGDIRSCDDFRHLNASLANVRHRFRRWRLLSKLSCSQWCGISNCSTREGVMLAGKRL